METGNNYLNGLEQPHLRPTIFFTPKKPISNMSSELTQKYGTHLHNLTYSSWQGTVSQCLPLSDVSLSQIAPSYLCLNMLKAPNFWKNLKETMKTFIQQAPTFLFSVAS